MDQPLIYTAEQLLSDVSYGEPLIANDVRCHGGFDADGTYRSPRTKYRNPAISAWQDQVQRQGGELIHIDRALVPPQYPNVQQAKLLLNEGVREPIVRSLTIISVVEGFGATIRDVPVKDFSPHVVEPLEETALGHVGQGLFEAHARDEAGWGEHGGHKQMWEAARDLALENPKIPSDVLMRMMGRRAAREASWRFPQLDHDLEATITMMARVLVIEVFAASTFDWGVELLSDPEVSANPEQAGRMVEYIRADESPHVEYLRTTLSELRQRTLRTVDDHLLPGREVVDGILHSTLANLKSDRPRQQREQLRESLKQAMKASANPERVMEEFDALETQWTPPDRTGFEPPDAA